MGISISKEKFILLSRNACMFQHLVAQDFLTPPLFLSWVLSFRSGSGDRVWSPTVSEDGKTSPYMEPDSQVTTVYLGFTKEQVTGTFF